MVMGIGSIITPDVKFGRALTYTYYTFMIKGDHVKVYCGFISPFNHVSVYHNGCLSQLTGVVRSRLLHNLKLKDLAKISGIQS